MIKSARVSCLTFTAPLNRGGIISLRKDNLYVWRTGGRGGCCNGKLIERVLRGLAKETCELRLRTDLSFSERRERGSFIVCKIYSKQSVQCIWRNKVAFIYTCTHNLRSK